MERCTLTVNPGAEQKVVFVNRGTIEWHHKFPGTCTVGSDQEAWWWEQKFNQNAGGIMKNRDGIPVAQRWVDEKIQSAWRTAFCALDEDQKSKTGNFVDLFVKKTLEKKKPKIMGGGKISAGMKVRQRQQEQFEKAQEAYGEWKNFTHELMKCP